MSEEMDRAFAGFILYAIANMDSITVRHLCQLWISMGAVSDE